MMDSTATYDTADWRGVCPVCGDEIAADATTTEVLAVDSEAAQWAHETCARKDEDDA